MTIPLPYLARGPCPEGEHLTKSTPVVCVPNKEADGGAIIDPKIIDTAWAILTLAAVILAVRAVWHWWRRHRADQVEDAAAAADGRLFLGPLMSHPSFGTGDLGWGSMREAAFLPRERLGLHVLVAGATGSGKSTTVDRIELEAVTSYRPQVIHFDCKGRRDGAARFLSLMLGAGFEDDRVRVAPVEPYDGWRGDERAYLNRLMAVQDFSERQPYYTAATKDLLQQSIGSGMLPRFSGELLERLAAPPPDVDAKVASGALARYRGFFHGLGGLLDGSWAFDDIDACYIELPGMARREDAIAFGRYLLEDFMHYIAERKDPAREVLLVLDDFSAISSGEEAVNLIERAREFGVGVVLTTQSYAGLGPGGARIVDAANGALIVHRMSNPEPFIARAGTVWRQMVSVTEPAHQPGIISGVLFHEKPEVPRHTTRDQEFPRIDANDVRNLPPGDAYVIADGRMQRIRVTPVDILDEKRDMPLVGPVSLVDLGRGNLNARKEMNADLHRGAPSEPSPPPDDDPDLDF